jgi:hypothetical protein
VFISSWAGVRSFRRVALGSSAELCLYLLRPRLRPRPRSLYRIWHDGSQGLYDSQLYDHEKPDEQPYFNWRGIFTTDEEGRWSALALKPTPYPIPYDNV